MEKLRGYAMPFDISLLKHRADLIEQDGPLLSLYYNEKGDYYLFYWIDCDERANRWMILRVDNKSLYEYLDREKTLLQVVKNPSDNFVWITDIDSNGAQVSTLAMPVSSIPLDYLPGEDSWFDFDHREELLKEVSVNKFEVDIPQSDKSLFTAIISKMGWRLSSASVRKIIDKIAF